MRVRSRVDSEVTQHTFCVCEGPAHMVIRGQVGESVCFACAVKKSETRSMHAHQLLAMETMVVTNPLSKEAKAPSSKSDPDEILMVLSS